MLVLLGVAAVAQQEEFTPPTLTQYVTDQTGTLTAEQQDALERQLAAFDKQTSTQIVVLMVPTIGDTPVEEASLRVAELNKIGRKGRDNGALLFIAKNDRRVRIEVGYGLEGALPDITAGQIIRNELAPHFRDGDYYSGISAAVTAMMQATRGEYTADEKSQDRRKREAPFSIGPLIFIIIIFFIIFRNIFRRRGRGWGGPFIFPGGFGGRGFGGGGFGGGGFGGGGFSGGGGSFGGGGASGRW